LITQNFDAIFPLNEQQEGVFVIDPLDRFCNAYSAGFVQRTMEYTDSSFGEAYLLLGRYVEEPEKANMLGQLRHARCETGFRRAAEESRLIVTTPHTKHKGGRYSLIEADNVYLLRSTILPHCGTPRFAVFRQEWASINKWLDPVQPDFWNPVSPPPADRLCGMIVTTAHPHWGNPRVPAFVGLGIPRADLKSWAVLISLPDLLARYHRAEVLPPKDPTPKDPAPVKDRAIPRIRKKANDN
jgi:hypothetical protein